MLSLNVFLNAKIKERFEALSIFDRFFEKLHVCINKSKKY